MALRPIIMLAITVIVLVAGILVFGPAACNRIATEKAKVRLGTEQTKASKESTVDAIETQAKAHKSEVEAEALTRKNEREIRDAEGADVRVHADAHAAGLRALCRRPAYRDSERCRLLAPRPE